MQLFDSHAHLNDDRFSGEVPEVLQRMAEGGVTRCTLVGADMASSRAVIELAQAHPGLYAAVGVHPHDADQIDDAALEALTAMTREEKVVAWGEIGLDYYYDIHDRRLQVEAMLRQMDAAKAVGLPMIFHVRDAWGDFLPHVQGHALDAVAHCWTGSWESAKICLDAGMYVSFSGSVTFKNAVNLREVAKKIPEDRLLIETDSPYLAPVPHRGHRNEPTFVRHVLACLAEVRGADMETLAEVTFQNACRFYRIHE